MPTPKMQKFTINDFNKTFPDDAACLDWLREYLYPNGIYCQTCATVRKHHRVTTRQSYSCDYCGNHVHPTAGTVFHKTRTPLRLWFYAIYLMASTRCGISAKQLQRETGVTYKTAWRMFKQIRSMLKPTVKLSGKVEVDDAVFGGKSPIKQKFANKTHVVSMAERGGPVNAVVAENLKSETLLPILRQYVMPSSLLFTDSLNAYRRISGMAEAYRHQRVRHSANVYVSGDCHVNTVESFWGFFEKSVAGVYHSIGKSYLQTYLDEYTFRWNHRKDVQPMFISFLERISKAAPPSSTPQETLAA